MQGGCFLFSETSNVAPSNAVFQYSRADVPERRGSAATSPFDQSLPGDWIAFSAVFTTFVHQSGC